MAAEAWTGDIAVIGLAVMGQNLILNMADKGFNVVAYNRTVSKVDDLIQQYPTHPHLKGARSVHELVSLLKKPRKVVLLVQAGAAVDASINSLLPAEGETAKPDDLRLEPGDIIIDGGNSYWPDSNRRWKELEKRGYLFVGSGVSGGEEGARHGPSLMPGGAAKAWPYLEKIFNTTAAQVDIKDAEGRVIDKKPCCGWVGAGGSGHYVKMVHNGIEYGDMQIIAEAYDYLKRGLGIDPAAIGEIFEKWNKGVLDSFLIQITSEILKYPVGEDRSERLVEIINDVAGQKGTGKWTAIESLNSGMPLTLIGEAVFARYLSSLKDERIAASKVLRGFNTDNKETDPEKIQIFINDLEQALYAAKIISYAQGFMLMKQASTDNQWGLDYGAIAGMWRGGCIIKSAFLGDITNAFTRQPDLTNLLFDSFFKTAIEAALPGWRATVARFIIWGIPAPTLSSALAFYDGFRSEDLPANMIQAQRDYFGAHTFRVKKNTEIKSAFPTDVDIHVNWTGRGGNVASSAYVA